MEKRLERNGRLSHQARVSGLGIKKILDCTTKVYYGSGYEDIVAKEQALLRQVINLKYGQENQWCTKIVKSPFGVNFENYRVTGA